MLHRYLRTEIKAGGGKTDLTGLTKAVNEAATTDLIGEEDYPWMRRVIGKATRRRREVPGAARRLAQVGQPPPGRERRQRLRAQRRRRADGRVVAALRARLVRAGARQGPVRQGRRRVPRPRARLDWDWAIAGAEGPAQRARPQGARPLLAGLLRRPGAAACAASGCEGAHALPDRAADDAARGGRRRDEEAGLGRPGELEGAGHLRAEDPPSATRRCRPRSARSTRRRSRGRTAARSTRWSSWPGIASRTGAQPYPRHDSHPPQRSRTVSSDVALAAAALAQRRSLRGPVASRHVASDACA